MQNKSKSFWCEEAVAALGFAGATCGVSDVLAYSRVFVLGCCSPKLIVWSWV